MFFADMVENVVVAVMRKKIAFDPLTAEESSDNL
jgi:hypothetical protein